MFLLKKGTLLGANEASFLPEACPEAANVSAPSEQTTEARSPKASPAPPPLTINPALLSKSAPAQALQATPAPNGKLRVMLCGTYPIGQSNGYSRVVYYIAKYLGLKDDLTLTIYGFQNYNQTKGSQRNDISPTVILHDAMATESPRRNGFGEKELPAYLRQHPQDIVIIFNDPVITTSLVQNINEGLTPAERAQFKLLSYMDQVYPYQRKDYIALLNQHFNGIIAFTPYWKDIARSLGIRADVPIYYFPHGFDSDLYYPIPTHIARAYHQLPPETFILLNLNRNQPRKRWDYTMMVMADIIQRHQTLLASHAATAAAKKKSVPPPAPIQLVIGTQLSGFFDLLDILEHELKLRGYTEPKPLIDTYIHVLPNAQMLSDRDINLLYNACDIGLNTCDGEGFGLCQFEHLALGKPQVAPAIGGFREFLNAQNSAVIEPKWRYYVDRIRDGIGGMAEVGDPADYAAAIWKYYQNPALAKKHGRQGRTDILQHYRWDSMVEILYGIVKKCSDPVPDPVKK